MIQLKVGKEFMMHSLIGQVQVPADKSISHRAFLTSSICQGKSQIYCSFPGNDVLSTINCLRQLGIIIEEKSKGEYIVFGKGMHGFSNPSASLDCGNSGTTTRLLIGLLCGQKITGTLSGDESLSKRPMKRVTDPLEEMGGRFTYTGDGCHLPVTLLSHESLHGIFYKMPIASAQIKSSLLYASLYSDSFTTISEPVSTRDHTERMLKSLGVHIAKKDTLLFVQPPHKLSPFSISIPGDISSAFFLIAAALLVPQSDILIHNVGLNPTRTKFLTILIEMGADITATIEGYSQNEPYGTIHARYSTLNGLDLSNIPVAEWIDEIPVLSLLAAFAHGTTIIHHAQELRVKESDRISLICSNLKAVGASVTEFSDGFSVTGGFKPVSCNIKTGHDHRIAMTFALLNLYQSNLVTLDDASCIQVSYPGFETAIQSLLTSH